MILKFYVNHQTLQLLSRDPVIADSSGYLQANFQFTDDWEGTDKAAQFKRTESKLITDGKPLFYDIAVDSDGNCTVPWEVLVGEGAFNVNIYGQKTQADGTTVKTITVNSVDVPVGESGLTKDIIPQDSTPSRYDNIYEEIKKAEVAAASSKAAAAISETDAKASADNAKASETAAKTSQTAAKASETNSVNSATASANSAKASATSADNAAKSATASANSATASANSAKAASTSEANAKSSQTVAATSATNAASSASDATTQAHTAKAWATSTTSPDGAADTASTTGKTQSAKSWAMYSKDRATASATSASAASTSANAAKTSEENAASSKSAAATSATNAANSAKAAADSATAAANSAREQQADWDVTDTTSKAFIKNKPEVLTYQPPKWKEPTKWESNTIQSIAQAFPEDHPAAYAYGVKVTLGKIKEEEGHTNLYFPHNGGMYLKTYWGITNNSSGWLTMLDSQNYSQYALPKNGTAVKATADAAGNNIQTTYAKKSDISSSVSTTSLTVTGQTSVPTANAGNSSKAIANTEFVAKSISALVNGAPDQLNTLNELAKALGNDSNFASTVMAELAKKLNSTEAESTYATKTDLDDYLPLSGGTLTGDVNGVTPAAGDNSTKIATTEFVQALANILVPTGVVQAFAGSTIPTGWLLCDGSAVSRTDYAALYAVIGTTYGTGNGSTTFNLPNLIDKFVEGSATAGTVKSAGLPNITGMAHALIGKENRIAWDTQDTQTGLTGPFYATGNYGAYANGVSTPEKTFPHNLIFDASRSNPIYGASNTVQPPALTMRYIIKY